MGVWYLFVIKLNTYIQYVATRNLCIHQYYIEMRRNFIKLENVAMEMLIILEMLYFLTYSEGKFLHTVLIMLKHSSNSKNYNSIYGENTS